MLALLDRRQTHHARTRAALVDDAGPYLLPVGIMAEIAYMIERRLGDEVMKVILSDIEEGAFSLDCGLDDVTRIRELIGRYADPRLGYADATVVACAERNGGRVLSLDRRDLAIVAREGRITLVPDLD